MLSTIKSEPASFASRAATHFYIEKNVVGDRTVTTVTPLNPEQRVDEVARMLGGADMTAAVIQHAREMLLHGAPTPAKA